jgi:hypothetical protein
MFISDLFFHPGSRSQKSTGSLTTNTSHNIIIHTGKLNPYLVQTGTNFATLDTQLLLFGMATNSQVQDSRQVLFKIQKAKRRIVAIRQTLIFQTYKFTLANENSE